eukprot:scaffold117800_cov51-Attheya_sp.AAC.1
MPRLPVYYVVHVLCVGSPVAPPLHWQSPPVRHLSPRKIAAHHSWLPLSFQVRRRCRSKFVAAVIPLVCLRFIVSRVCVAFNFFVP